MLWDHCFHPNNQKEINYSSKNDQRTEDTKKYEWTHKRELARYLNPVVNSVKPKGWQSPDLFQPSLITSDWLSPHSPSGTEKQERTFVEASILYFCLQLFFCMLYKHGKARKRNPKSKRETVSKNSTGDGLDVGITRQWLQNKNAKMPKDLVERLIHVWTREKFIRDKNAIKKN